MTTPAGTPGYVGKEREVARPSSPTAAPRRADGDHRLSDPVTSATRVANATIPGRAPGNRERHLQVALPDVPSRKEVQRPDDARETKHPPVSMPELQDPNPRTREDAWNRLFKDEYPKLHKRAIGFAKGDPDAGEDLVQTAFTQFTSRVNSGKPFENDTNPAAYLQTTLRNVATNAARSAERHPTTSLDEMTNNEADNGGRSGVHREIADRTNVEEEVLANVGAQRLLTPLRDAPLTPDQKKALALFADGYTTTEIAGETGVKAVTINTRIFRGRKIIDNYLSHTDEPQAPDPTPAALPDNKLPNGAAISKKAENPLTIDKPLAAPNPEDIARIDAIAARRASVARLREEHPTWKGDRIARELGMHTDTIRKDLRVLAQQRYAQHTQQVT